MIRILSRTFLESFQFSILENCENGKGDRRAEGIILCISFTVHVLFVIPEKPHKKSRDRVNG